jgi:hypothetical protein
MPRDRVVATALAHLLAPHSRATPKQAKEPTFPPRQKEELVTDDLKTKFPKTTTLRLRRQQGQ